MYSEIPKSLKVGHWLSFVIFLFPWRQTPCFLEGKNRQKESPYHEFQTYWLHKSPWKNAIYIVVWKRSRSPRSVVRDLLTTEPGSAIEWRGTKKWATYWCVFVAANWSNTLKKAIGIEWVKYPEVQKLPKWVPWCSMVNNFWIFLS